MATHGRGPDIDQIAHVRVNVVCTPAVDHKANMLVRIRQPSDVSRVVPSITSSEQCACVRSEVKRCQGAGASGRGIDPVAVQCGFRGGCLSGRALMCASGDKMSHCALYAQHCGTSHPCGEAAH
eukprot:3308655-Pleurochrysis_carterae.AAC.2